MNDQEFAAGVGFVANVLSVGIERLPEYKILPMTVSVDASVQSDDALSLKRESPVKKEKTSQGVKRNCGHSHKSVRMEHKKN